MTDISIVTVEEQPLLAARARATFHGDYAGIPGVHQAIHRWCAEQNLVLAGPCWELYGEWHDDPARRRTDMYHLLA